MAAFLHAASAKHVEGARRLAVALASDVAEREALLAAKVLAGGPDLVKSALELAAAVGSGRQTVAAPAPTSGMLLLDGDQVLELVPVSPAYGGGGPRAGRGGGSRRGVGPSAPARRT